MRTMVSVELDDEDKLDAERPIPMQAPDYPYGLRICLTEKEIEKLELDPSDAKVGGTFHLMAMARVTSVSMTDSDDGPCHRIEAQIEELSIEDEDQERADED